MVVGGCTFYKDRFGGFMYKHIVQYYETDKMGIVHHSNYIRWMEEARTFYMKEIGCDYVKFEEAGIFCPVIGVNCKYKAPTTFGDIISIHSEISEFNGVKLVVSYVMKNEKEQIVFEGKSEHCFIDKGGKLLRLKKAHPKFYGILSNLVVREADAQ